MPSQWTLYCPFSKVSLPFKSIVLISVKGHALATLFFKILSLDLVETYFIFLIAVSIRTPFTILAFNIFSAVPNSLKDRQNTLFTVLVFEIFSTAPIHFKYRQSAPFTVLVFEIFSTAPIHFKYRQSAPFTVLVFILFSAVPNRLK